MFLLGGGFALAEGATVRNFSGYMEYRTRL